jgi:Tfp pilus assembly protein PilF
VYAETGNEAVYEEAINNIENENFVEAIKLLQSIQDSGDYLLFFNLGYCYYQLENDEQAQLNFKRSIELNGEFLQSYGFLGMSYLISGKLNEAEETFLKCIELDGTYYRNYFFLGKIYEQRNNTDKAIDYYLEALKHDSTDFFTNYSIANIFFDNDDYVNAQKYFEICDEINDQIYPVVSCLIRIKYRHGDLENIEKLKQRLREIKQESDNENIRRLGRFTIDVFTYNDYIIFAEESFNLSGTLYYHWVFRIHDKNENFLRSVNLESSVGLRQMGTAYIIGIDIFEQNRRIHHTTNVGFTELPEYNVMKNYVIQDIEKGLEIAATGVYPYNE